MIRRSAILNELQILSKDATNPKHTKPQTRSLRAIAEILNNEDSLIPDFIDMIKRKIVDYNFPVTQYLLLDLIEYTTCRCGPALFAEYNSKSFLKVINTVLKNEDIGDDVKEKALYLVQFWARFFEKDKSTYKNFAWYKNCVESMGIPFPQDTESPYERARPFDSKSRLNLRESQVDVTEFNKKQLKLFKDLETVIDSMKVANSMIDEGERAGLNDVIGYLDGVEVKLKTLVSKLRRSNEDFLYRYTLAIIEDIDATRIRQKLLQNNKEAQEFKSRVREIILIFKRENNTLISSIQSKLGRSISPHNQKKSPILPESTVIIKARNDTNKHDSNHNNKNYSQTGDKDLEDDFLGFDMSNNIGDDRSRSTSPIPHKINVLSKEMDLLDLNTITPEQQKKVQQMIKPQSYKNDACFDFTIEDNNHSNHYKPKVEDRPESDIKFEKNVKKEELKPVYDPFSDIGDFDLLDKFNKK